MVDWPWCCGSVNVASCLPEGGREAVRDRKVPGYLLQDMPWMTYFLSLGATHLWWLELAGLQACPEDSVSHQPFSSSGPYVISSSSSATSLGLGEGDTDVLFRVENPTAPYSLHFDRF